MKISEKTYIRNLENKGLNWIVDEAQWKVPNKATFVKKQHTGNFPRNLPWTSHWFPEWVWYCSDPHDCSGTDSNGQPNELIPSVHAHTMTRTNMIGYKSKPGPFRECRLIRARRFRATSSHFLGHMRRGFSPVAKVHTDGCLRSGVWTPQTHFSQVLYQKIRVEPGDRDQLGTKR